MMTTADLLKADSIALLSYRDSSGMKWYDPLTCSGSCDSKECTDTVYSHTQCGEVTSDNRYRIKLCTRISDSQCFCQSFEIGGCRGVESEALVSNPAPILCECHYCAIDYCVLACV